MATEMEYRCGAKDYLDRARVRLSETNPESLFYAALELRFGIEARLKEYFDAQAQTTKMKRDGWKISSLANHVESVFKSRDKALRLTIFDPSTNDEICVVLYTPVTTKLQKLGQRLGDYLHAPDKKHYENRQWLAEFREKLDDTFFRLEFALSGTLLAPPLSHPKNPDNWFFCLTANQTQLFPHGRKIGIRLDTGEIEDILIEKRQILSNQSSQPL